MTAFTSGKRAEVGLPLANHDPEPFFEAHSGSRAPHAHWFSQRWAVNYDPRPEFDVPDNPILVEFRDETLRSTPDRAEDYLLYLAKYRHHALAWFSNEQIDHARRVLSKLTSLS